MNRIGPRRRHVSQSHTTLHLDGSEICLLPRSLPNLHLALQLFPQKWMCARVEVKVCLTTGVELHTGYGFVMSWEVSHHSFSVRVLTHQDLEDTHTHTHRNSESFSNNKNIEPIAGLSLAQGFLFTCWLGPHSAVFFDIRPWWSSWGSSSFLNVLLPSCG